MGLPCGSCALHHSRRQGFGYCWALGLPQLGIGRPVSGQHRKPPIPSTCLRVRVPDVLGWRHVLSDSGASAREEVCMIVASFGESSCSAGSNVSCGSVTFALDDFNAATDIIQPVPDPTPQVSRRARCSRAPCRSLFDAIDNASIVNVYLQRREGRLQNLDEPP